MLRSQDANKNAVSQVQDGHLRYVFILLYML